MIFEISHDANYDYFVVKYHRLPTPEEFDPIVTESAPIWGNRNVLFDMTSIDPSGIDRALIDRYISIREKHPERGKARIAILVGSSVSYGLGRMYQTVSGLSDTLEQRIRVFSDREQAERWIRED